MQENVRMCSHMPEFSPSSKFYITCLIQGIGNLIALILCIGWYGCTSLVPRLLSFFCVGIGKEKKESGLGTRLWLREIKIVEHLKVESPSTHKEE